MKTLKLSYRVADHDLNVKIKAAQKFLDKKEQVKFIVQLRGREVQHTGMAIQLLERVRTALPFISNTVKVEGKMVSTVVMPGKKE